MDDIVVTTSDERETIDRNPKSIVALEDEIESLRAQLAAANAEVQEQARLNGMGAEREATLRAQLEEFSAELEIAKGTTAALEREFDNHTATQDKLAEERQQKHEALHREYCRREELERQLAEVTKERDNYREDAKDFREQVNRLTEKFGGLVELNNNLTSHRDELQADLLATQAHAARLVEALEFVLSKHKGGLIEATVRSALSTPINLDALLEHDAQLLRGIAEKWKGIEGISPYEFLINEAAAHRAKKEGK